MNGKSIQLTRGAKAPYDIKLRQERLLAICDAEPEIERSFFINELLVVSVGVGTGSRMFWRGLSERLSRGFRREYSYVCMPGPAMLSTLRDAVLTRMNALQFLRHFRPTSVISMDELPSSVAVERFNFVAMLDDDSEIPDRLRSYFERLAEARDYETIDDFIKTFVLQAQMLGGFEVEVEGFRFFDDLPALLDWCLEMYERSKRSARHSTERCYSRQGASKRDHAIPASGNTGRSTLHLQHHVADQRAGLQRRQ